jgi:hypothetical protein
MRDWTTVQNIRQLFPLTGVQLGGPSTPMALQQTFIAMFIPSPDPSMRAGAIHLQGAGDLTGSPPLDTEHDGLQTQGHTGRALGLSGLALRHEMLEYYNNRRPIFERMAGE